MAIIELQEVSKLYGFGDATTLALEEVSLNVRAGQFVAVMGPSGSGKSTLMNLIGLLDRPTHGQYILDGRYAARLRANQQAKARRDKIGFVFQNYNLLPRLNVLENVALPLAYRGMMPVRRLKRASDMLERVGLRDREYYMPRQLSNGQLQRVTIARALINNPSIIIADEPTGNLDSSNSRIVMELLSDIHRQGNTILMVTHNPELTRYANRVIYMYDGSIVGDEQTALGDVAPGARGAYLPSSATSEDHFAEGVSTMMRELPSRALKGKPKRRSAKKPKKRIRKRSYKRGKK